MVFRVVIDTNIYISAIFWDGKPMKVIDLGRDSKIIIFTSTDIENEIAGAGVVATGILPRGFYAPENSWGRLEAKSPEVVKKFIEERLPRKFLGRAEELIPMILLLCSNAASMMGGCLVPIDAGEGRTYTT